MPLYYLKHTTRYAYAAPITDSANQIILSPPNNEFQKILEHEIRLSPNAPIDYFEDYFGNTVGMFTIVPPHQVLDIVVLAEVQTQAIPEPVLSGSASEQWSRLEELNGDLLTLDYLKSDPTKYIEAFHKLISETRQPEMGILDAVKAFTAYIYNNFTYSPGVTNVETNVDEIWELKAGVCQDFAHLLLELLRLQKIPARYVSGYICPAEHVIRGEGATHAWVEIFLPGYGWLGVDPTNNCLVNDGHIKIAVGRNFDDCTPVKGTYKGTANHTLSVSVVITKDKSKLNEMQPEGAIINSYVVTQEAAPAEQNSYRKFIEAQQQQ